MTFREVETLFHEFGHALQHMLTNQTEGLVSGIRNIEWDAVELPSQFMENWCAFFHVVSIVSFRAPTLFYSPAERAARRESGERKRL